MDWIAVHVAKQDNGWEYAVDARGIIGIIRLQLDRRERARLKYGKVCEGEIAMSGKCSPKALKMTLMKYKISRV